MSNKRRLIYALCSLLALLSLGTYSFSDAESDSAREAKPGIITGKIMAKGGAPLSWGQVMFYNADSGPPPMPDKYFRTPDTTMILDAEGRFRVELPPGRYYLEALKRMSGEKYGMRKAGDYVLRNVDAKGRPKEYVVKSGVVINVGKLASAVPLRESDLANRQIRTAVTGSIVDADGTPVSDAVAVAYLNPAMQGVPLFISDRSDKSGSYVLRLTPGTYYLRVRNNFVQGPPEPGQIVGQYGEGDPAPVMVNDGEIVKDIHFTAIYFGNRGPRPGQGPPQQ